MTFLISPFQILLVNNVIETLFLVWPSGDFDAANSIVYRLLVRASMVCPAATMSILSTWAISSDS
jgi:hypothetical protein